MKNVIPRKAKRIAITFLIDTSYNAIGTTTIVEKNAWGDWSDGRCWYPVGMMRDGTICKLDILA